MPEVITTAPTAVIGTPVQWFDTLGGAVGTGDLGDLDDASDSTFVEGNGLSPSNNLKLDFGNINPANGPAYVARCYLELRRNKVAVLDPGQFMGHLYFRLFNQGTEFGQRGLQWTASGWADAPQLDFTPLLNGALLVSPFNIDLLVSVPVASPGRSSRMSELALTVELQRAPTVAIDPTIANEAIGLPEVTWTLTDVDDATNPAQHKRQVILVPDGTLDAAGTVAGSAGFDPATAAGTVSPGEETTGNQLYFQADPLALGDWWAYVRAAPVWPRQGLLTLWSPWDAEAFSVTTPREMPSPDLVDVAAVDASGVVEITVLSPANRLTLLASTAAEGESPADFWTVEGGGTLTSSDGGPGPLYGDRLFEFTPGADPDRFTTATDQLVPLVPGATAVAVRCDAVSSDVGNDAAIGVRFYDASNDPIVDGASDANGDRLSSPATLPGIFATFAHEVAVPQGAVSVGLTFVVSNLTAPVIHVDGLALHLTTDTAGDVFFQPGCSATANGDMGRVVNHLVTLEASDDAGVTWNALIANPALPEPTGVLTFAVVEIPHGATLDLRASTSITLTDGDTWTSGASSSEEVTQTLAAWWLAVVDSGLAAPFTSGELPQGQIPRLQDVYDAANATTPVVTTSAVRPDAGQLGVVTDTDAAYAALRAVIDDGRLLTLRDVLGRLRYIKILDGVGWRETRIQPPAGSSAPYAVRREVSIPWREIAV